MRSRRTGHASGRPLNFTVRPQVRRMREPSTPAKRAPIEWVAAGCALALIALVSILYAGSAVPEAASLEHVSGVFESSKISCDRRFLRKCWITFCLRGESGRTCLVTDDKQLSRQIAADLRTGEPLEALGRPVSDYDTNLWVWELRRGWVELIPYEQSAADARDLRRRYHVVASVCLVFSAIGFGKGLLHWVRWRSWDLVA